MQGHYTTQPTTTPVNVKSENNQNHISINEVIALVIVCIAISLHLSVASYKKYRKKVQRQKIATLEKQWHLDNKKKNA